MKQPINENYAATVVKINSITPIEGFDNLVATNIFGNNTLVSKDIEIGTIGLYFPPETQLYKEYLKNNNLYRDSKENKDETKKGYFEDNGRVKTMKFRGFPSLGIFMPLDSLSFTKHKEDLKIGDTFDEINNIKICKKYIIREPKIPTPGNRNNKCLRKISKLIENQFRLHGDTQQLGKHVCNVNPNDIIQCSKKIHGTSVVISNILCKRYLNPIEKILKSFGVKIKDTEYSNVYSSRKVVQNDDLNPNRKSFYRENIYAIANNELKEHLTEGITFYAEICGYLPYAGAIQKDYDYGNEIGKHSIYIYRITYTNPQGYVYEFSAKQVKDFCIEHGIKSVPELYYGYAKDLFPELSTTEHWHENFLEKLKEKYLEKDCDLCNNKVPAEGIVLRIEKNILEVYKLKSYRFFELSTKYLDENTFDMEEVI